MTASAVILAWAFDRKFPWYIWLAVGVDIGSNVPRMINDLLRLIAWMSS